MLSVFMTYKPLRTLSADGIFINFAPLKTNIINIFMVRNYLFTGALVMLGLQTANARKVNMGEVTPRTVLTVLW